MSERFENKKLNQLITEITERVEQLPVNERIKVISLVLTPEVKQQMKRDKKVRKLFKTIEEFWDVNPDIDEDALEQDIQEAVNFSRNKLV